MKIININIYKLKMESTVQEKSLINTVRKATNDYLKNTNFGYMSIWHGATGKTRAERILACLNNSSLEKKPSLIWEIVYAIFLTRSTRLKKLITEQIIHYGSLGLKLRAHVANYDGKMELEEAQQKGIMDMAVEKIKNVNSTRISNLKTYFDQSDTINEQALNMFFDVSIEK
jgi:hypothetical protein